MNRSEAPHCVAFAFGLSPGLEVSCGNFSQRRGDLTFCGPPFRSLSLSLSLSLCLCVYTFNIYYLSIYLYLSKCLCVNIYIYIYTCLSIYLSIYLSMSLSLSPEYMFICAYYSGSHYSRSGQGAGLQDQGLGARDCLRVLRWQLDAGVIPHKGPRNPYLWLWLPRILE